MYSNFMHTLLTKGSSWQPQSLPSLPDLQQQHAKWIPSIEITLKEAGEWNGWSLGSRQKKHPLIWIHYESDLWKTGPSSIWGGGGCDGCNLPPPPPPPPPLWKWRPFLSPPPLFFQVCRKAVVCRTVHLIWSEDLFFCSPPPPPISESFVWAWKIMSLDYINVFSKDPARMHTRDH